MRLQSAIFTLGDTLFTPDGAAREGLDKALSLFKICLLYTSPSPRDRG